MGSGALATVDFAPLGVVGGEDHAVAVEIEPFSPMQDHIVVDVEIDLVFSAETDPSRCPHRGHRRIGRHRIDQVGLFPAQPEHHGFDTAVTVSGRPQ